MGNQWVKRDLAERFWEKVRFPILPQGEFLPEACWEWQAHRDPHGYGRFSLNDKKVMFASRMAWELVNGPIPAGLLVLHRCDNPPCCNTDHLFLGTDADNMADMWAKGRARPGRLTRRTKVTREQAVAIRAERASGTDVHTLGARYGISRSQVWRIVTGQAWASECNATGYVPAESRAA